MGGAKSGFCFSVVSWGSWQGFPRPLHLGRDVLGELLDGGQSFRWNQVDGEYAVWQGVFGRNLVQVRLGGDDITEFRLASGCGSASEVAVYFGQDRDWKKLIDALPWRSDLHLQECMKRFPGLRILRQPFGETLFSFLCSSAKQIVQIKQCCLEVARQFGEDLGNGSHAWPGWSVLADVGEAALRECKLGYRARYVSGVARILSDDPDFETRVLESPFKEARNLLMELPGVGAKVADCVLLFGAGKLEAFPVDTWVTKVMSRVYGLAGWDATKVTLFGSAHFGSAAGLAQQFLFARERRLREKG